jgi:hypothetical protein
VARDHGAIDLHRLYERALFAVDSDQAQRTISTRGRGLTQINRRRPDGARLVLCQSALHP